VELLGFTPLNTNPDNLTHLLRYQNVDRIYDRALSGKLTSANIKSLILERKQVLANAVKLREHNKVAIHERFEQSELMNLAKIKYPNKSFNSLTQKELSLLANARVSSQKNTDQELLIAKLSEAFDSIEPTKAVKKIARENQTLIKKLCPHLQRKVDLIIEGRDIAEVDEQIKDEFCHETKLDAAEYYCDECGQILAYVTDEEEVYTESQPETDQLYEYIYHEVGYLIRSYLRFKMDIKVQVLIDSFTAAMHGEISNIEAKLKQIQTNITDDLKDLINIHIAVYTFAMMSHFILTNYGKVTFAQRLTIDTKPKSAIIVKDENDAEKIVESDAEKIVESDAEKIVESDSAKEKTKLKPRQKTKAKVRISKSGGRVNTSGDDQKELKLRLQNILKNAYYLIIMTKGMLLRRVSTINSEKIKQMLMMAYKWVINLKMYKTETETVDMESQLKSNMVYSYMIYPYVLAGKKPPNIDITSKDPFGEIKPVEFTAWPKSGNDIYDQYTYKSYAVIFDYLDAYKNFSVPRSPALIAVDQKCQELRQLHKRLAKGPRFIYMCRPYQFLVKDVLYAHPDAYKSNYNRSIFYNDNGQLRKYDKYLMSNKKTYTIKELKELDWKTRKSIDFVDWCSDQPRRSIKPTKVNLDEVFESIGKSKGFYEYYTNKCPEGEVHEFKEGICTKCKLKSGEQDTAYFKKYIGTFNKYLKIREQHLSTIISEMLYSSKESKQKDKGEQKGKFKYDEASILEWSRFVKRPFGALMNLGFSEGQQYDNILKEKINPAYSATEQQNKNRLPKLHSHLSTLMADYNAIRTFEILDTLPLAYKSIVKQKIKLPDLFDAIGDIDKDFRACKLKQTYKISCNFVLSTIAKIIKIVNGFEPKLAIAMTDILLDREKTMSKPSPFKIKVEKGEYSSSTEASEAGTPVSEITVSEDEERIQGDEYSLENTGIVDVNDGNDDD
jgi:hypothetical protein